MQLKGRVACQISSHELLLTELLFENVLSPLAPEESAALLSCLVFTQNTQVEPHITNTLQEVRREGSFLPRDSRTHKHKHSHDVTSCTFDEQRPTGKTTTGPTHVVFVVSVSGPNTKELYGHLN